MKKVDPIERWFQCYRKAGHPSRSKAKSVARRVGKRRGIKLYVYKCPHCGEYHLTKKARENINASSKT